MTHNVMGIDPCDGEDHEIFNTTSQKRTFVDARTGLFEAFVQLPTIICNEGLGPAIDLSLSYTPMVNNSAGLGDGWSFAFTTYDMEQGRLRLHSGETVEVSYRKNLLSASILAYWGHDGRLTVKLPGGRVEVLLQVDSSSIFAPRYVSTDGVHFATLKWSGVKRIVESQEHFQIRLDGIGDRLKGDGKRAVWAALKRGSHVWLEYPTEDNPVQSVVATFWPETNEACSYTLITHAHALKEVVLPLGDKYQFSYLDHAECGWLLNELVTPEGLTERVEYKDNGLKFHNDEKLSKLPCVATHVVIPARGQEKVVTSYEYAVADRRVYENGRVDAARLSAIRRHIDAHRDTLVPAGSDTCKEIRDFDQLYAGSSRTYIDEQAIWSTLEWLRSMEVSFPEQGPYETTMTCAGHVEKIVYGSKHQVLESCAYEATSPDVSVCVEHLITEQGVDTNTYIGESLVDWNKIVYAKQLMVKRTTPKGTVEWNYLQPGHTIASNAEAEYTYVLAQLSVERTVYPDGSETTSSFTYVANDPRPATRTQSLLKGSETLHEAFEYGPRGLSRITTTQAKGPVSERSFSHEAIANSIKTITKDRIGEFEQVTWRTVSALDGRVLSEADVDGNVSTFKYDRQGRLIESVKCTDSLTFQAETRYAYPSATRMEVTEPNGLRRAYEHDGRGNVVEEYLAPPASDGETAAVWKLMLKVTYDNRGRRAKTERYDYLPTPQGEQVVTQRCEYTHDKWGNEAVITADTGVAATMSHDPEQRITVERQGGLDALNGKFTHYNPDGTVSKILWRDVEGKVTKAEGFTYQGPGLVTLHAVAEAHSASTTAYYYDARGRCTEEHRYQRSNSQFIETALSDQLLLGRPFVTEHEYSQHYLYDYSDNLFISEPTRIHLNGATIGSRTFDSAGRVTSISSEGREESFTYDRVSRVPCQKIAGDGTITKYRYFPELGNRVALITHPQSRIRQEFTYATHAEPISQADQNTLRVKCSHDVFGRPASYESSLGVRHNKVTPTRRVTYRRSMGGRLLGEEDVAGGKTDITYDDKGRRSAIVHQHAGGGNQQSRLTLSYDECDRVRDEHLVMLNDQSKRGGNDTEHRVSVAYAYDTDHRETSRSFITPMGTLNISREYDGHGRLLSSSVTQGGKTLGSQEFSYDHRGHLIGRTTLGVCRPLHANKAIDSQTFIYNNRGDITECKTSFAGFGRETTQFHYSSSPYRLAYVTRAIGAEPAIRIDLTYDAAGRVTKDQNGRTYRYDALGRAIQVGSKHYLYDGLDRLIASSDGKDEKQIIYDDLTVRGEYAPTGDDMRHRCLDGAGLSAMCVVKSGVKRFIVQLKDYAGTVVMTVDLTAQTLAHHAYTAYGSHSSTQTEALCGFNGEYRDPDTDQYPLGNGYRWYSPDAMRFNVPDSHSPFGDGGPNATGYCGGDPINRQDPTGHWLWLLFSALTYASSTAVLYGVELGLKAAVGEKAAGIITAAVWSGIGVATALATGGLSLWVYAAVVTLAVVAFSTAIASAAVNDEKTSEILGWVSFSATIFAGSATAARKAGMFAVKSLQKLSTKLGGRSNRCLRYVLHTAGKPIARHRSTIGTELRGQIEMQDLMWDTGSLANMEALVSDLAQPAVRPQPSWTRLLKIWDSGDANTLVCTVTGVMGLTNTFESDRVNSVVAQSNNDTWLPWGNWDGFAKFYSLSRLRMLRS